ncbi:restriction endonuclease subunit S [Flavobacterium sufflavum]|uniref:Restriction endonuclease subunit S n=1 Tax=Flavobacterium sufflavum TaxID=1921138 RepID=A0A437KTB4_9FLAO|nr:restriction endonuclease subunit S [Flavobacterium sufflavum]RVT75323.1 restriction endonuclease subunit S [Flavobacterium sufflavum]
MTNSETYTPTHKQNTIPSGWSSLPINEVFEFIGTSSFSRNDLNYEAGEDSIYYIHYGDIHATYKNAVLDFDTETRIPVLRKEIKPSTHFLKEGDLIIADASEDYEGIGEALEVFNLKDKKVLAGLHTFALRDKDNKTVHGYRAYLFKNPDVKKRLKTIATGSKVYGISKGNISKFRITLPPLWEQQKITKILTTWNKAITLQQQLIRNKKEYKKAIMKKLLTGEVRFKNHNNSQWSSLPINEVFEFIGTSSFSRNDLNYEVEDNSIYYIHYGDIHSTYKNAVLDFNTETRIPVLNKNIKPSIHLLQEGDLIIADASEDYEGVGESLEVYNLNGKKVLAGLHTFALRDKNNQTAQGYRAYLFKSPEAKKRLKTIATGSKVYSISKGNLTKFKITLPSLVEQQKTASFLSFIDKEITNLNKELFALRQQRQGLIQQLLTGKIRVK